MPKEYVSPRDMVRRVAERHGERIAVSSPESKINFRELAGRTARAADILKRAGVGPGIQVAISLPNCVEFLIWYFGIFEAGGIVVSLPPNQTPLEAADVLDKARVSLLITPEGSNLPIELGFNPAATTGAAPGTTLWRVDRDTEILTTMPWTEHGLLQRFFSSGSTGRPKHMFRTEINVTENLRSVSEKLGLSEGERFLAVAPFGYGYGLGGLLTAFYLGGSVSVLPRFVPSEVIDFARRDKPTVFLMTPPLVEILANCFVEDGDERAFDSLKHCECSTGLLRKSVHDAFFQRYGISVRPRYGTTEIPAVAIDLDDGFEEGMVGRPFPGVTVSILDEAGNLCPEGATGQVAIKSAAASDHYVGDPEMSARAFRDGYVFPGDEGYFDDQGRLHVVGRRDIINIGGSKVDRLEVERVIRDALPVTDVVVMEGKHAGAALIRAVIEGDPERITRAMVIAACRAKLSRYKIPARIEIFEKFERDANGKALMSFFDDRD